MAEFHGNVEARDFDDLRRLDLTDPAMTVTDSGSMVSTAMVHTSAEDKVTLLGGIAGAVIYAIPLTTASGSLVDFKRPFTMSALIEYITDPTLDGSTEVFVGVGETASQATGIYMGLGVEFGGTSYRAAAETSTGVSVSGQFAAAVKVSGTLAYRDGTGVQLTVTANQLDTSDVLQGGANRSDGVVVNTAPQFLYVAFRRDGTAGTTTVGVRVGVHIPVQPAAYAVAESGKSRNRGFAGTGPWLPIGLGQSNVVGGPDNLFSSMPMAEQAWWAEPESGAPWNLQLLRSNATFTAIDPEVGAGPYFTAGRIGFDVLVASHFDYKCGRVAEAGQDMDWILSVLPAVVTLCHNAIANGHRPVVIMRHGEADAQDSAKAANYGTGLATIAAALDGLAQLIICALDSAVDHPFVSTIRTHQLAAADAPQVYVVDLDTVFSYALHTDDVHDSGPAAEALAWTVAKLIRTF